MADFSFVALNISMPLFSRAFRCSSSSNPPFCATSARYYVGLGAGSNPFVVLYPDTGALCHTGIIQVFYLPLVFVVSKLPVVEVHHPVTLQPQSSSSFNGDFEL